MTKLVVVAVLLLALAATADAIRPRPTESAEAQSGGSVAGPVVHPQSSSGFTAGGKLAHTRVLRFGREFLGAEAIRDGFPAPLQGAAFDIAHLAARSDGTLVLAIYAFPQGRPAADGIEIWRRGRLESAFEVPVGSFGGGIGFASDGRLVAALAGDGTLVRLFTRSGRPAGRQPATSW
jgi:hypothetical protein